MSNLLDTPKLGFGCMRLPLTDPKDQKSIDIEHVKKMVDAFMEAGGTYFDTAYVYHEGESEVAMRKALVERYPRDSFTLATKCLAWAQPTAEAAKACLDTSLEQIQENVREWKENEPFTAAEEKALGEAMDALKSVGLIPCTNCRYCAKDCPAGVKIPEIMGLLNLEKMTENREFVKGQYSWQAADGKASTCTQCGACEDMCPQGIGIIDLLEDAADFYE